MLAEFKVRAWTDIWVLFVYMSIYEVLSIYLIWFIMVGSENSKNRLWIFLFRSDLYINY